MKKTKYLINIKNKNQKYYFGFGADKFCKGKDKDWCKTKEAKEEKKEYKKRLKKYAKQRKKYGFDDTELWNLDKTITSFILPRLKRFKKITYSYPSNLKSFKKWQKKIDKMIEAFELLSSDNDLGLTKKDFKKIKKGLKLFSKYFRDLWI